MAHGRALALKLGYTTLILFAVFGFFGLLWVTNILVTAVIVTGLLYVIGDLWILPNFGRWVTSVTDILLTGLIIWATELILVGFGLSAAVILTSAVLIGVAGHFFHLYVEQRIPVEHLDGQNK